MFVITIGVALVATVVSIVDSIDLTVLTMYGYNKHLTVVTPRNALSLTPALVSQIERQPGVRRAYTTRPAFMVVKTLFGKMPYVVFGLSEDARRDVLARCGLRLKAGRMPAEGQPEVVMSGDIARNKQLRIGDVVLKPEWEDNYAPMPVKLVGVLEGPVWLAVSSESFVRDHYPVNPEGYVILADDLPRQRMLDRRLTSLFKQGQARAWTYLDLVRDTREALSSLYLIMSIVTGIVVFAIAFQTGMLASIYFTQRLPEFATLTAIGYQKGGLLLRVLGETVLLCVLGWALGSLLTVGILTSLRQWMMGPRGLLLDPFDAAAYRFAIPLPLTVAGFALVAIWRRLSALDPVTIIERRG